MLALIAAAERIGLRMKKRSKTVALVLLEMAKSGHRQNSADQEQRNGVPGLNPSKEQSHEDYGDVGKRRAEVRLHQYQ